MKTDRVKTVLREADAAGEFPVVSGELARRVFGRARRRRMVRRSATVVVAAIVLSVGCLWVVRQNERLSPGVIARTAPPAAVESNDGLSDQARLAEKMADLIVAERLGRQTTPDIPPVDPLDQLDQDVNASAAVLIDSGERLSGRPDGQQRATEIFRSVTKYFPATHWASVAEARLQELKS